MHRATRAFLDAGLGRPHDGPVVVVTHHAPHPDSLPSRHRDHRVGRTRIVCDARGHADEMTGFQPGMIVAVAASTGNS